MQQSFTPALIPEILGILASKQKGVLESARHEKPIHQMVSAFRENYN
jgi:hypothetical protein